MFLRKFFILLGLTTIFLGTNSAPFSYALEGKVIPPRGLFALSSGTTPLSDQVLNESSLTGVSLRAHWSDIEPEKDQFIWSFDREIERARQARKRVMLRVSAGVNTPRWVFDAGAKTFQFIDSNPYHKSEGEPMVMPIPWDPVFLANWKQFIKALGSRYAHNDTVVLVHMNGLGKQGGEMHLPKNRLDRKHWRRIGYSKEKLVSAWKTVIDTYSEAFPSQYLCLNVSVPLFKDGVVEEVVAYAREKIGPRFCIQHNALAAKTKENGFPHRWAVSARGKAIIGFQLLCPATSRGKFNEGGKRFGGTLAEGFDIGLKAGASYFEIYPLDLKEPTSFQTIHDVANKMSA